VSLSHLPATRPLILPAGRVALRELPGPPGAPTIVLIHGLAATADVTFSTWYGPLAQRYRVLAFDQRGHGGGIRSSRVFRLSDCADDVVAMADAIGVARLVVVGYSLGGAIAQLVWRRHPERVAGLVLCATAAHFNGSTRERANYIGLGGLAAAARLSPRPVMRFVTNRFLQKRSETWEDWALAETAKNDWRMVLEAGAALGSFRSDTWIGEARVPAAVVVTADDTLVPPARQRQLADLLPGARCFPVAADHDAAVASPLFVPTLVEAIESVVAGAP
jgi:3-oxoadipate enol-lactonase